ncbi:tyrosine-type recombinase/integrase [Adlercreutzia sp. ZJ141]|uniref:tyrosine-type recombinase/integrase n=1 Tax=Adlercreutzia sp. ZJ141 TaxID=2709406 RepID=UPI0013EA1031|nr:tyrosine-type recombinase/integrase [Adlercreutzia sp. ZJ141]
MCDDIRELVNTAEAMLRDMEYKDSTICHYRASWNKVIAFCKEKGIKRYSKEVENSFFIHEGIGPVPGLTPNQRDRVRHVRCLLTAKDGKLPKAWRQPGPRVPEGLIAAYNSYVDDMRDRGLSDTSIRGQECVVRRFLASTGATSPAHLRFEHVITYIEGMPGAAAQSKANNLYVIRSFLRHLAVKGMCDSLLPASMPVIPGHKHSSLPSAYGGNEIAAMLATDVSNECPKRNYAMLLCASVMGMRSSDIRNLLVCDLDWRAGKLSFTQSKTGARVTLPMPDEVKLAIADYMRTERPDSADPHVFLHARAPYKSFKGCRNAFHYVTTSALRVAGVDPAGRHHGMHSLRHSAATNMLAGNVPYPVISGVLGHSNANTTRKYLAVDVELLRAMSLEVPHA